MKKNFGIFKGKNKTSAPRENQAWRNWCEAVLAQVRFQPDHPAIRQELMAHLEDSCADLERLGYDRDLAEQRALGAMGSASLVGSAMDRAHHPLWGWLWQATRILVLALAAAAVVTAFVVEVMPEMVRQTVSELQWEAPPEAAERVELKHATVYAAPGEVWKEDGHVKAEILLWVRQRDPLAAGSWPPTSWFTYRDSQGELSAYRRQAEDDAMPESRYWECKWAGPGGWTRFRETLELTLDAPPEWVEISYPADGEWTLRVDWGSEA
ncbi:permease prefix domain 1-containing protein [uncultured Dysosmobacter sp.]|uniref:permease prefix domain 1-containing protein n=1 Tax=uncultured Dysosmobacter sp. TaxID=2591384 RepID=UPI00262D4721|nr:permease prefix domain 1-containing protein [uncultured Dysosmobacter sp.]